MKKAIIWLVALILCLGAQSFAATSISGGRPCPGGGSGCGDLCTPRSDGANVQNISEDETYDWEYQATSFTATSSGSVKTVTIKLKDAGTPDTNLKMWLCADNAGAPDSSNGVTPMDKCTEATTTAGPPGGTYISQEFSFAGYAVTASTQYHIVVAESTPTIDGSNYYATAINPEVTGENRNKSRDGISWTNSDGSSQWNLQVSSCE